MALVDATEAGIAPVVVPLTVLAGQTGNGDTVNTADRGANPKANSTKLRITTSIGATPTVTFQISVSSDNVSFGAATYADVSTPSTDVATTIVVTTGTVLEKIIKGNWRYIKVTSSANTNVTFWIDVIANDVKRWV